MWNFLKQKTDAFITVECSLILTVLLIVYTFLIGIGFYFYNQCILQSNIGIMAVEGTAMTGYDTHSIVNELQKVENRLYKEKYYMIEIPQTRISVSGSTICIEGNGDISNPLFDYGIGSDEWAISSKWTIHRNNPKKIISSCKRIFALGEKLVKEEVVENE